MTAHTLSELFPDFQPLLTRTPSTAAYASSSSSDEDEPTTPASADASGNPLAKMSPEEIAQYLLKELKEQAPLVHKLKSAAEELGADGMWALLTETGVKILQKHPITTDANGKPRTGGGIFLQLLKARQAEKKREQEAAKTVPVQQGLTLRPYQAKAVESIQSHPDKNWVVAAPTNSGKSAIFITVAKHLISSRPTAKVVLVVPTISLLIQQANAFEQQGGFRLASKASAVAGAGAPPVVDWFGGDKRFPSGTSAWSNELQCLSVMVFEANTFLNLLKPSADGGPARARMADVDLLIMDECHHTDKLHPYASIMDFYSPPLKKPQVLGFSASPANGSSLELFLFELERVCRMLGNAQLHVIPEDDPGVMRAAPAPQDEEIFLPSSSRSLDPAAADFLRLQMFVLARELGQILIDTAQKRSSLAVVESVKGFVAQIPSAYAIRQNQQHQYNLLCQWMRWSIQMASEWRLLQFGVSVEILEMLRKGAALCGEMGFECGLRYVLQHLEHKVHKTQRAASVFTSNATRVDGPSFSSAGTLSGAVQAGGSVSEQGAIAALHAYVQNGPSAAEKQAQMNGSAAAKRADVGSWIDSKLATEEPYPDVPAGTASALVQKFLAGLLAWADTLGPAEFGCSSGSGSSCLSAAVLRPFQPGGLQPSTTQANDSSAAELQPFPKLLGLLECLEGYRKNGDFHAIIFTRTRQGAYHLAKVLETAMQPLPSSSAKPFLKKASVHVLTGHGEQNQVTKKRQLPNHMYGGKGLNDNECGSITEEDKLHGMSVAQQRAALEQFSKPLGRRLLVATTAAEEGLDVPSCELVVRFSPATTGVQRVQAKGRGRKENARYVCLIQNGEHPYGGSDQALHEKSKQEERALKEGLLASQHASASPLI